MTDPARLRQEAKILGIDVDAVVLGQGQANFEFARQVMGAVDRLGFGRGLGGQRLAIEPDFVIGTAPGCQMLGQLPRRQLELFPNGMLMAGRGAGHDVAIDVAAGTQSGQQAVVDARDGCLRSCLRTPCSWMLWRLVKRRV